MILFGMSAEVYSCTFIMILGVRWCWVLSDIDSVFVMLKIDILNEWKYKTWEYILNIKNEVSTLISNFKDEIPQKFETIKNRLNTIENSIKTIISDQVSEKIMKVKDSVIETLKEDNIKMQNKVEILKEQP